MIEEKEFDEQIEHELAIITKLAKDGLHNHYYDTDVDGEDVREYFGQDIRMTHVMILPVFQYTDYEDVEHETVLPFCTAASAMMKYGIIKVATQALDYNADD